MADLFDLRHDAGMTQAQVAERLQILPCNVSLWEHGITRPHPLRWPQLAELYGVDLETIEEAIIASAESYCN